MGAIVTGAEKVLDRFCLNGFERCCVMAALYGELETEERMVFSAKQILDLFGQEPGVEKELVYETLGADSMLMRYFLQADEKLPVLLQPVQLQKRMRELLLGYGTVLARELTPWLQVADTLQVEGEPHRKAQYSKNLLSLVERNTGKHSGMEYPVLIGLYGAEGSGRRYRVRCLSESLGMPLLTLDSRIFTGKYAEECRMTDAVLRECICMQAGLMLLHLDKVRISPMVWERLFSVFDIIFASAGERQIYGEREYGFSSVWIPVNPLSYEEALELWEYGAKSYEIQETVDLARMPERYTLTPGMIWKALEGAAAGAGVRLGQGMEADQSGASGRILQEDLDQACHQLLTADMGRKVQRIVPAYSWGDLALPVYQKEMLRVACSQVRYRHQVYDTWEFGTKMAYGRGVSMVFSGLPGTGKTMAAQVIAAELGMELYRVDLASVVSKYIGETEKNLEEIFEQAKAGQVILFFDEADVLFSKRTEVKDSNDKYSNMEAAYMLQKMESHDGIVILSTNYIQNFDEAFKRRMKLIIDFPFPDEKLRREIWEKVFPAALPLGEDVDLDFLARQFEFSGSNIKNSALYASFLAAARQDSVNMKDLILGVRNECSKTGKILQREDLGEYCMLFGKGSPYV